MDQTTPSSGRDVGTSEVSFFRFHLHFETRAIKKPPGSKIELNLGFFPVKIRGRMAEMSECDFQLEPTTKPPSNVLLSFDEGPLGGLED